MTDPGDGGNVVVLRDDDRDEQILKLRLAGLSIRRIAREFKISDRQVLDALDRMLPVLSPEARVRMFREDLCRLDELLLQHWTQARSTGSQSATQLVIRLMERRSAMCGYDAPVHARVEVIEQAAASAESSTAVLLRELNRIASERSEGGGPVIESEAERAVGGRAPELPEDAPPAS